MISEKEVNEQLKAAMKSGEKTKLSVLRMLLSEIKNKKIADLVKELDDDKVLGLVQKMIKQHKESIEKFKEGNRDDLVQKEAEELVILEAYLPKQITEEELAKLVAETITELGAQTIKDMGKVMNCVMAKVKGSADGRLVSKTVKEKLEKNN
ncbi:MAG: GatB/YqeY domain-containing protein [Candidatus Omnitrophica bacterium]|nr:GatB/YqeY domain-containing protein [Candidatus Omnitrophota bacterium]